MRQEVWPFAAMIVALCHTGSVAICRTNFNLGGNDDAITPGPTIFGNYHTPIVIRRFNDLPPQVQSGGFGVPEVSTHIHNMHDGSESDGGSDAGSGVGSRVGDPS